MRRKKYFVEVIDGSNSVCLFETYSVTKACKFLESVNFEVYDARFFRDFPFYEFDIDSVLEVINA